MQSTRTENTQNYEFLNRMLDTDVMLYRPLARFCVSMDYQEVPISEDTINVGTKEYSSKLKKEAKWVRMPDSLRTCPECHKTTNDIDGIWEYCEESSHDKRVKTEWLHWRPRYSPTGFDNVLSMILANASPAHSTTNLPETMDINKFALWLATNIDEATFINSEEWLVVPLLSRPECLMLEQTITGIAKVIWERSMKGSFLSKATSSISVQERIEGQKMADKRGGLKSWLGIG